MKFVGIIAALAAFGAAVCAEAAPITISTGSASWQVTQTAGASNNGAALNTTTIAAVLTGSLPASWVAPPAGSAWIGQRANDGLFQSGGNSDGATDGTYVYTLSWNPGAGGNFSFNFAGDNTLSSLTVTQGAATLYSFTSSSLTNFSSLVSTGLVNFGSVGAVLITATLVNAPFNGGTRNPSGFLLAGTANVNDTAPVPLPAAAALMPLGLAAFAGAARRKKAA